MALLKAKKLPKLRPASHLQPELRPLTELLTLLPR
jgi:hypothetical protein